MIRPDPECPLCSGYGSVDSGGITPWGEGIDLPCCCLADVPWWESEWFKRWLELAGL